MTSLGLIALAAAAAAPCDRVPLPFGCANIANLRAMAIAADLVRGRAASPADGAIEASALDRWRADKVKDLRREGSGTDGGAAK